MPRPSLLAAGPLDRLTLNVVSFEIVDHSLVASAGPGETPWRAVLAVEGTLTGDGRFIEQDALSWRDLPLSLAYQNETPSGFNPHGGAVAAGRIDDVSRDGAVIRAEGAFTNDPDGLMAANAVRTGKVRGVSVELDSIESRYDLEIDEQTGEVLSERYTVTAGRIMSAVVTMTAAFADALIEVTGDAVPETDAAAPIAASAAPHAPVGLPPRIFFDPPEYDNLQPLTIDAPDANGWERVHGHFAPHQQCHIGMPWTCETPPDSASGYSFFTTGSIDTDHGRLAVGRLTYSGMHADDRLSVGWREAQRHYEDVALVAADIVVGSDAFGQWYSGALRPGLTDEDRRMFMNASPSGDWRDVRRDGTLELVGIHQVCTGGFPVPRLVASVLIASGAPVAMIAAGVPRHATCDEDEPVGVLLTAEPDERIDDLVRDVASLTAMVRSILRFGVVVPEHL